MPKQRTKKAITKRFRITPTGKVLRGQSFTSHLRVKKSKNHKRRLAKMVVMEGAMAKKIQKVMGVK